MPIPLPTPSTDEQRLRALRALQEGGRNLPMAEGSLPLPAGTPPIPDNWRRLPGVTGQPAGPRLDPRIDPLEFDIPPEVASYAQRGAPGMDVDDAEDAARKLGQAGAAGALPARPGLAPPSPPYRPPSLRAGGESGQESGPTVPDEVRAHLRAKEMASKAPRSVAALESRSSPFGTPDSREAKSASDQRYVERMLTENRDRAGKNTALLEMLKDISEGLGNIEVTTGAQVRAGLAGRRQPFVAESIREAIQEKKDALTPDERQAIQDYFGVQIPEGASFSRIERLLPHLVRKQGINAQLQADQAANAAAMTAEQREALEALRKEWNSPTSRGSKLKESILKGEAIAQRIEQGGLTGIDLQSVARELSQAAGDTGRLSEQDIAQFLYRAGLPGLADKVRLWMSGTPTEAYEGEVLQLVRFLRDFNQRALQSVADSTAEGFLETGWRDIIPKEKVLGVLGALPQAGGGAGKAPAGASIEGLPMDEFLEENP